MYTTDFPYKRPFNDEIPPGGDYVRSGVGEVVYHLALEMDRKGHDVVISTTSADQDDLHDRYRNIAVLRHGKNFKLAETDISLDYLFHPPDRDADVIHLHAGSPPATIAALRSARQTRTPLVVTHHLDPDRGAGGLARRALLSGYTKLYLQPAFTHSARIIALSDEMIASSPYLGPHLEKVRVIPNGINPAEFQTRSPQVACRTALGLPENDPLVLFFGNLVPRKGLAVLLSAMPAVLRSVPDARLVIAGMTTPFGERLRDTAETLGIADSVIFTGVVREDEKPALYHAADVFVLPSYAEAYPLTVLEAAAAGVPAVVSSIPVFRALVQDGKNGLVSKTGDAKDLAAQVIRVLTNHEEREAMGRQARAGVEGRSWAKVAEQTEALYQEIA
ncbi:glycosyltransferase involved in cell wall biosynthesis [Methanofollis sp. W23]|uniref:glycosyltransferase family 4 protein n=1 Tax=Methanofollis sp. W23 TaxID=2817849 RepID=UPI001AE5DC57|nr:glycosyltransferase family 4 protein [Methanofollis sp. W23]MBP2144595.1 glycosyltransferase involved in cell wall biosynthesis [Methanofollis sp. W23]